MQISFHFSCFFTATSRIQSRYQLRQQDQKPTGRFLTKGEVFAQVAKLFQNQKDLLNEFSQFLPEVTGDNSIMASELNNDHASGVKRLAFLKVQFSKY